MNKLTSSSSTEPDTLMNLFAAEPASVIYMLTGAVCLCFSRTAFARRAVSSSLMFFCQKNTREKLSHISLT